MKKFTIALIVLLIGLLIFNVLMIDFSDSLLAMHNQMTYLRLAANVLVLFSLVLSYRRYGRISDAS